MGATAGSHPTSDHVAAAIAGPAPPVIASAPAREPEVTPPTAEPADVASDSGSGIMPDELVMKLTVVQFVSKTLVEIVLLPLTYVVVARLKKAEQEDYYDRNTDFNPLKFTT